MTKLELAKTIGGLMLSVGVTSIVTNVINTAKPANIKGINKLCVGVAAIVLTNMANEKVAEYAGKQFNDAVQKVKQMVTPEDVY